MHMLMVMYAAAVTETHGNRFFGSVVVRLRVQNCVCRCVFVMLESL